MGNSTTKEPSSLRPHVLRTQNNGSPRSAVIMGPTGATGKFILAYFICSPEWERVTVIHRRQVDLDVIAKQTKTTFTDEQKAKVVQHVVDMGKLCENEETINKNVELFKGNEVTICVLGTTRAQAGSAEGFRKVDHYMVRDGGILSQKAGIPHFSVLTSKGANSNFWANEWKIAHGLLYLQVKGDAEQSIIDLKFPRTSIFRPGALGRDCSSGGPMGKLSVRDLAAAMVYDAESDEINVSKTSGDNDADKKEEAKVEQDDKEKQVEKNKEDAAGQNEENDGNENQDEQKEKANEAEKEESKENEQEKKKNDNNGKKKKQGKVEKVVIYESADIDNMLVLAQRNYDAVVCAKQKEQKKEVQDKDNDDVKEKQQEEAPKQVEVTKEEESAAAAKPEEAKPEEAKQSEEDKGKENEPQDAAEAPKEEEPAVAKKEDGAEEQAQDEQNEEVVNEEENHLNGDKYEVVEKPAAVTDDAEDNKPAAVTDEAEDDKPGAVTDEVEEPKNEDYVEVQSGDAAKDKVDGGDEQ